MSDPADDRERRELERRAFARDGSGLSEAEAARLAELRRTDLPSPLVPERPSSRRFLSERSETKDAPRSGTAQRDEEAPSEGALVPDRAQRDEESTPSVPDPPTTSRSADGSGGVLGDPGRARLFGAARSRVRTWIAGGDWTRPRYLVGGLGALVLVGVLIGWAIPRPPDVGLALRDGESARASAVLKHHDDLDPGSLLLLARERDGLLWYATQANGRLHCAILDVRGADLQQQCGTRDQLSDRPLYVNAEDPGAAPPSGYAGSLLLAGAGVPAGVLQRYHATFTDGGTATSRERADMRRIVADNHLVYASVVGRVGDTPVWLGDDGSGRRCLIVEDPDPRKTCDVNTVALDFAGSGDSGQDGPALTLRLPETGAHPAMRIDFWAPQNGGQYLVITQDDALFHLDHVAAD
jgi:hypothetical protein